MKKHTLYVFLLVVLVIPFFLSCSSNVNPLEPETENTSSESIITSVAFTPTPSSIDELPIYPPSTSNPEYYDEAIVNALIRLALYEEAIEEMNEEHFLEFDAFTYVDMCLEISLHGNAADILPICEQAVEKFPNYEEALFTRGIARSKTGDYEGAISDFENFLEIIDKTPEKEYSSKNYKFVTDIHLIEYRIREWIEILKTQQNPITNAETNIIPAFEYTYRTLSDFDEFLKEFEQKALLKYKHYDAVIDAVYQYFKGDYPPSFAYNKKTNPEILQQRQILDSISTDMFAYSTVCFHGCFAGDIDSVDLYCERVEQIYQSIPDYIDPEDRYSYLRNLTISSGVYHVYHRDYDEAKTFFEDYLLWQQSTGQSDDTWVVSNATLEEWIDKLENNQFPFEHEHVIFLLEFFPWH